MSETVATLAILRGTARPDFLKDECLAAILAATAARNPSHPALSWGERVVTYDELAALGKQLGAALASKEVSAGKVVGLFLPRGADLLIAQAGIAFSGAAWLPFDAEAPLDRLKTCLASAQAAGLVTCRKWLPRLRAASVAIPLWALEDLLLEKASNEPLKPAKPSDPAYVIYTSGSTGQPKGIVISHRSICHFLRSENELLGVRSDDRVYQGFSVAFDMSFEEIWISYLVGATLWIAPASITGDPDSLVTALAREHITVLHAVPTLLGLIHDPLPSVRLINLGGEACPDSLVARLAQPGRQLFNTYGPTETAVSASLAELAPDKPVTIGTPLPNYVLLVIDENHRVLTVGQTGELCIAGPGLALGYLGRDDLTAQRFIANPTASGPAEARMYLTGDLAQIDADGSVHFLGRADSQVKIRGFRVELDEIQSALSAHPEVAASAGVLRTLSELEQLVAFVVPTSGQSLNLSTLRHSLAARLPHYMVPAHFEILSDLPRLTSGKTNHHDLRSRTLVSPQHGQEAGAQPANEDEAALFATLAKLFPGLTWQSEADFFDDLGGHSLLAAKLVSLLRNDARYTTLSVQAVYRERKLGALARALKTKRQQQRQTAVPARSKIPRRRRLLCGLAQACTIPFFVLLHMADWLAPFFVYHYFTGSEGDRIPRAVMYSLATFVASHLATFIVAILGKRFLAGPLKAGRYPLWGVTYFRWWLATRFNELPDVHLLAGTPWMPWYLRALGAKIGRDVIIDTVTLAAPELVTIDNGVSIGTFVTIENARVEDGQLIVGPVHLQRDAVVDSFAVFENDTGLGIGARLCGQSSLAAGRVIPNHETWDGAPARRTSRSFKELPPRPNLSRAWLVAQATFFAIAAIGVAVLFFMPAFPAFMLIDWIDAHTLDLFESERGIATAYALLLLLAIPASALFLGLTMLVTAGIRWLLPRQAAGRFPIYSVTYWRKRVVNMLLDSSLHSLHGIYASVYAPTWLRSLGVTVGRHAEISTAEGIVPELLCLGEDSFIADGVMLGDEELRGGWMVLEPTKIGNRSFIGNGAYVPDGATVPDDVLIGVQTRTPANEHMKSGQTWIGSPPMLLPARECIHGFPETLTFRPSPLRRVGRGLVEALRIVLPLGVVIATGYLVVILIMPLAENNGWGLEVSLALSAAGCLYGLVSFLGVLALKWLLIGRYRPKAAPMWTPFVWLSEAITNLYESLAVPNFLNILRGTPMLPWALRALGTHIGQGVFLNTTDITEFDCVSIGDGAELNALCGPQTHLFEDRVMKIGTVKIGAATTIGVRSTILYDSHVGDSVHLGPLTLVAKGEQLPTATRWEGSPANSRDKP